MTALDDATRIRAEETLIRARIGGHNRVEALHRAGLLWTPQRERDTKAQALRYIVSQMEDLRPAHFLFTINRSLASGTPADMHRAVMEWLQKHIKAIEEGP